MSRTLEGTVELVGGMTFRATSGSGHTVTLDGTAGVGGAERGATPMELLLLSLGGCTGITVLSILQKMRQEVTSYQIHLSGDEADEHPRVFTRIQLEHVISGRALNPELIRRAIELSATRYCPAMAMLSKAAPIEETYRIVDDLTAGGEA